MNYFREPYLLHDDDDNTIIPIRTQQKSALVITHELAHMWFGNEVTPDYWNYVWLSEGFATYFEFLITSQVSF